MIPVLDGKGDGSYYGYCHPRDCPFVNFRVVDREEARLRVCSDSSPRDGATPIP